MIYDGVIIISSGYIIYINGYIYIPRESHVYSLPWILCKSYSLPRPGRPRADHADHALTPFINLPCVANIG